MKKEEKTEEKTHSWSETFETLFVIGALILTYALGYWHGNNPDEVEQVHVDIKCPGFSAEWYTITPEIKVDCSS